jgi:hypothetical protein
MDHHIQDNLYFSFENYYIANVNIYVNMKLLKVILNEIFFKYIVKYYIHMFNKTFMLYKYKKNILLQIAKIFAKNETDK